MKNRGLLVAAAGLGAVWLATPPGVAQVVQQAQALAAQQPQTASIPLGPTLDVIPNISADGYTIQLNLLPTLTEFVGYDTSPFAAQVGALSSQTPLPHFRVRQVVTSCIVWDGQTVMLGGLLSEKVQKIKDKIPMLGDLPLLGRLFRSESSSSTKRNLVIFVTPTIIDPAGNLVYTPDNLPYDPRNVAPQVPFVPTTAAPTTAAPPK
jgi:type II secretory pathway component GspD/PulD (secretin)